MMNRDGGSLDLRGTGITSLPDNLTVGGYLDLRGTGITSREQKKVKKLKNGDYVEGRYIFCDNILMHVKRARKAGNYTLYIGRIKGQNVVTDGTNYAHCATFREGIADILFKTAADRGANQYKGLTLDSEIKTEDAIVMYRVITGACKQGTQQFINNHTEIKEAYTVREIIELTAGQYGAEKFKQFFGV